MATPLQDKEEGLPIYKGLSGGTDRTARDPGTSWEPSDGPACQTLKGAHRVEPHLAGHDDKHHASSTLKVPEHWIPWPFRFVLKAFSPSP
jgi:hypothetical protein